jgi:phosphonate transport system substrate-binding protein
MLLEYVELTPSSRRISRRRFLTGAGAASAALVGSSCFRNEEHIVSSTFLMDQNLGIHPNQQPWKGLFAGADIDAVSTTDLARAEKMFADHEADIAYLPSAVLHRLYAKSDQHYRGLLVSTSKFTGGPSMRVLLVVGKNDPATSLDDLAGAKYGYINRSCSSTYFPPSILLARQNQRLDDYFDLVVIDVGETWQELNEAVVSQKIRATMVLEDVWKTFPENAETTKVIGQYDGSMGPVVSVSVDFDEEKATLLSDVFLQFSPRWDAVYGGYKPFYLADMHHWFHDLDQLPPGA